MSLHLSSPNHSPLVSVACRPRNTSYNSEISLYYRSRSKQRQVIVCVQTATSSTTRYHFLTLSIAWITFLISSLALLLVSARIARDIIIAIVYDLHDKDLIRLWRHLCSRFICVDCGAIIGVVKLALHGRSIISLCEHYRLTRW